MGTILTTTTESQLFDLVQRSFSYMQSKYPLEAEQLFIKETIPENTGDRRIYREVSRDMFALKKPEGTDVQKTQSAIGYEMTMNVRRFGIEIDITWEFEHWNQHPEIGDYMKNVSEHCLERYDLDLTHRLTFANAVSYVNMDGDVIPTVVGEGHALLAIDHALHDSPVTYNNIVTGAPRFSQGAFLLAQSIANTDIYNDYGRNYRMDFNTVITSYDPATCYDVKQILGSEADIDASHAGVLNVNARAFKHIKLYRLDTTATGARNALKSKWWFYAAIGNGKYNSWQAYVGIWEANHLAPINPEYRKDIKSLGSRMSYGIVTVCAKGIIGSLAV